ncbi:squalene epoxidase-domain-containing protein [Obelidium mucronatum]|nr:squalene epoxidase-domain-containing protein [Obelidium mucronatum]
MPSLPTIEFDVIVVGAGIAGSAVAHALGRDGRKVMLIERDWKEPDRIVGELLQPGGIKALENLGMEDCLKDIDAIRCKGYNVIQGESSVVLPYSYENAKEGCGFHHGKFINKLREAAKASPNVTTVEGTVNSLMTDKGDESWVVGVKYSTKTEKDKLAYAPLTVIADGCFSKFRKEVNNKPVTIKSTFVGLILEDCKLPTPHHGHVILADPSPILLYQIGTHDTRALVDIPGTKIPSLSNGDLQTYMTEKVCPQLPQSVQPSFLAAVKEGRLRSMPNSHLSPATNDRRGVVLLGDANNMRHPLTGGGMTVAFWDVIHLRDLLREVPDLNDYALMKKQMRVMHWRRKTLSSTVNILANALYGVFAVTGHSYARVLQEGCMEYFKLGGICVSTPVGLLSGMLQSPWSLIIHFFAVAIYGMFIQISRGPVYFLPYHIIRALGGLVVACTIVLPLMFFEIQK